MTDTAAGVRRPMRADARRNYELLMTAAKAAFAEHGIDASLDDIARRAGVGPGTLYRHFPTRQVLLAAVFRDQVDELHAQARDLLTAESPGQALTTWLWAHLVHASTYRGLAARVMINALDNGPELSSSCEAMKAAVSALLARAQQAGAARPDIDLSDLLRLINGIALATEHAPDSAGRLFSLTMDGLQSQQPR